MSTLQKSIMKRFPMLPPMVPPPRSTGAHGAKSIVRDFSPVHWSKYFQAKEILDIGEDSKFCVYRCSNTTKVGSPVIIFLHGGGFSALTWSLTIQNLMELVECQVVAVDLRGHGETRTAAEYELTKHQLVEDLLDVARAMNLQNSPMILVGHSLGGALAVHFAAEMDVSHEFNVVGAVVIDVVEGSALESLATMNVVLRGRPHSFPNIKKAIEWCVKSGQIRSLESARVSMPGQLKNARTNEPATFQLSSEYEQAGAKLAGNTESSDQLLPGKSSNKTFESGQTNRAAPPLRSDVIIEEENESIETSAVDTPKPVIHSTVLPILESLTWRIDLNLTQPYWNEWFEGLSDKFLHVSCPKLLLLAGVDRLDRDLTVGQMQGKFQMHVFPNVGHAIQEDSPSDVAQSMASFLIRHKLVTGKVELPPVFPGC